MEGRQPRTNSIIIDRKFYIEVSTLNVKGLNEINFNTTFLLDTGTTVTYLRSEEYE